MKFIAIGDCVCDKYLHQKMMYPGGTALNAAVYWRMMGAESAYIGVIGNDPEGEFLKKTMDEKGVDRSHSKLYEGESTSSKVDLVRGERVFLWANGMKVRAEHPLVLDEADMEYIKGFSAVHTSLYSGMEQELPKLAAYLKDEAAKGSRVPLISFDISDRWEDEEYREQICPYADIVFLSCPDLEYGMAQYGCGLIAELGPKIVIATRGDDAVAAVCEGVNYVQWPRMIEPVDTLGAGDSFAAAFELNYAKTGDIQTSLDAAAEFAAGICLMNGAFGCGVSIE
jgi:sugar/nucleoside kinase (ribokinase family)